MINVYRLTVYAPDNGGTFAFEYLTLEAAIADLKEAKSQGAEIELVESRKNLS